MRLVHMTTPGVLELSWMYLPTFMGHDSALRAKLQESLAPKFEGRDVSEDLLDEAHDAVLDFLCAHYPIPGLRMYLDGVKFIEQP